MVREMLDQWYRTQAQIRIQQKVKRYAAMVGVTPGVIKVITFKGRWGSCSVNGDILFHWKIIMAPHHIVDYIVVHELCHLKHHNHSAAFWQSVERVIPDYVECKAWLKQYGARFEV